MTKYLFIEEWYDGGAVKLTAYGKISENRCEEIIGEMEKYSPYDYAVPNVFDTMDDYSIALDARRLSRDKKYEINYVKATKGGEE